MNSSPTIHISYRFYPTKSLEIQGEFREYLHSKIPAYTDSLLGWHHELCKTMVSRIDDWWLAYGSRIMAWIPPIYQPYFFAAALRDFRIQKRITHIHISEAPSELRQYILEIDPEGSYTFKLNDPIRTSFHFKLKSKLVEYRDILQLVFSVFRKSSIHPMKSYDFLIYSHFFGMNRWKNSGDHFYGKMFQSLGKDKKILWAYYPAVKTTTKEKEEVRSIIKDADCEFIDWKIKSFRHLWVTLKRILNYKSQVKKARNSIPEISLDGISCIGFSKNHYSEMVENYLPLTEWKIDLFFQNILSKHNIKRVIYPFEDKGLERAICKRTKEAGTLTYGYAHAVHNDGHLYFKINSKMLMPPRPHKVLATGPHAAEWISQKSANSIAVDVLGSNRYRLPLSDSDKSGEFNVLVLIGQAHELTMLANWADQVPGLFQNSIVTIRAYPYSDFEEQENAIKRLEKHFRIDVNTLSLEKQIQACDVVLFSSTSAAFEAMLMGRMCVYANLHDFIPLSPLKDKGTGTEVIESAETAEELMKAMGKIRTLSPEGRREIALLQRSFAEKVYAEPDISRLEQF